MMEILWHSNALQKRFGIERRRHSTSSRSRTQHVGSAAKRWAAKGSSARAWGWGDTPTHARPRGLPAGDSSDAAGIVWSARRPARRAAPIQKLARGGWDRRVRGT